MSIIKDYQAALLASADGKKGKGMGIAEISKKHGVNVQYPKRLFDAWMSGDGVDLESNSKKKKATPVKKR